LTKFLKKKIGLAGPPGAGKSTVSLNLCKLIPNSIAVPMDGSLFFL